MIPERPETADEVGVDVQRLVLALGITEEDFRFVMRDILWIACCYNDHNFTHGDLIEAANRIRRNLMVGKSGDWIADANRVMEILCENSKL